MEFEEAQNEDAQLPIENDQELLQLQKRKSTPKVVIQEFVDVDDGDLSSDSGEEKQAEKPKASPEGGANPKRKLSKLMTHHEIEDVSNVD